MIAVLHMLGMLVADVFKSRTRLEAENLFLRHQLTITMRRAPPRFRLRGSDRALMVWLVRLWPGLLGAAQVVQPDTVQCARLDVHELTREGKVKLRSHGWLFGAIWFEVTGGPNAQHLVLEFPCRSASGEQLDPITQDILCYWRKAHYGGRYLMFSCSECHSSARVLYAWYHHDRIWFFRCRKCAGITYQSTMGHRWGPLGASRREVTRSARIGRGRYRADQTARYA
jgi:hypothetical protein